MRYRILILAAIAPTLPGCIARTAVDLATAPVRIGAKAADLATTSQSEADEKRGRELRRREERLGKLERDHRRYSEDCADGDAEACARRDAAYDEIQALLPTVPVEPEHR